MAHNAAYTKVFVDTANDIGLGVHEVARCLGRTTLDVGHLCEDADVVRDGRIIDAGGKINKWAKYKPIRVPGRLAPLTDAIRANYDFGFDTTSGGGISVVGGQGEINTLMTSIITNHGSSWNYLPPRGPSVNSENYRLLDFDGYYHLAAAPYRVPSSGITINAPVKGYQDSVIKVQTNVEIDITQMRIFADGAELDDFYLGVLVKNGTANTKIFLSSQPLSSLFVSSLEEIVPIDLAVGTNYCQWCFTNIQPANVTDGVLDPDAGEEFTVLALPNSFQTFIVNQYANSLIVSPGWEAVNGVYFFQLSTDQQGYLDTITPKVHLWNNTSSDPLSASVFVDFQYADGNIITATPTGGNPISIAVDEEYPDRVLTAVQATDLSDTEIDVNNLSELYVRVRWSWGSTTRYYDFATDSITTANPGFVSLADYQSQFRII